MLGNGCALHTFWCIEWGSELCKGVMQACRYPFNTPKHWFQNMNIQVYCTSLIPSLFHTYPWFIPFLQDTALTVPQYPPVLEDPVDVPLEECWVTHERAAAKSQSHLRRRPHPSRAGTLQHLRKTGPSRFWSHGKAMCRSITSPRQRLPSTWAKSPMCWVTCP